MCVHVYRKIVKCVSICNCIVMSLMCVKVSVPRPRKKNIGEEKKNGVKCVSICDCIVMSLMCVKV